MKNALFLLLLLFSMSIDAKVVPVKKAQEVADKKETNKNKKKETNLLRSVLDGSPFVSRSSFASPSLLLRFIFAFSSLQKRKVTEK